MDYDRNDALLHWLFRQTQGDAWFRPNEENLSSGVALRVSDAAHAGQPEFRVFPYENASLEPFETAVAKLNPVVAVKVRSAAVHAALAEVSSEDTCIYVDSETRIQILDTMLLLPQADREQCAAFIRDERVMVIWSESIDRIVPLCADFEERLIKLLWRSRPLAPPSVKSGGQASSSYNGHSDVTTAEGGTPAMEGFGLLAGRVQSPNVNATLRSKGLFGELGRDPTDDLPPLPNEKGKNSTRPKKHVVKRTWYGAKKVVEVPDDQAYEMGVDSSDPEKAAQSAGEWYDQQETSKRTKRPVKMYAPIYNGLAAGLALFFIGNGVRTLLMEWALDGSAIRFALLAFAPLLYAVSLFFALQIVQNLSMAVGPIAHFHENSKYYSAVKPKASKKVDSNLPHVTIQMPVYKESLEEVLKPSVESLKKAMRTYARQGGTSNIFINDDGLRLLPAQDRDRRLAFYANHNIGWVARPKHDPAPGGFKRAGRFKKASNMNYALDLSLKMERHLENLVASAESSADASNRNSFALNGSINGNGNGSVNGNGDATQYGIQYQNRDGDDSVVWGAGGVLRDQQQQQQKGSTSTRSPLAAASTGMSSNSPSPPPPSNSNSNNTNARSSTATPVPTANPLATWGDHTLEEKALSMAIEEVWDLDGRLTRPWAANGKSCRIGEIVLLVDSDTVVPEDCLRDAAREFFGDENDEDYGDDDARPEERRGNGKVAIVQHESDVMQVVRHYFENGISYFTRRVNRCISISCANGEVAPFMGHNAFLRWRAIQDAAFVDPTDGKTKIWSETNVSEDFDMALRLILKGYIIRWATYSDGGFKEGVSLSADDELNRWQKYAYGCNELLFNPIIEWWRKGPISRQIHRFLWSKAPLHYKLSMLAYMFSYYGIAGSITIGILNYVILGFQFPVDGYFMHAFEIWLATTVVFWGSGTIGYTLLEYRLGRKSLLGGLLENLMWIPFFFFFFGGLAIPLTQAILAHLFSYNMQWAATKKEVERSNFFKEIPKIIKRFWFPLLLSYALIAGMAVLSTRVVPLEWRVTGEGWAVILPLALTCGCHILYPIVLNPWLMVFSY